MRRKILAMFIVTLLNIALIAGSIYLQTTVFAKYGDIQGCLTYTVMWMSMANYVLGYGFADITGDMSRSKRVTKQHK